MDVKREKGKDRGTSEDKHYLKRRKYVVTPHESQ